jgi:cytochrome c oxidase subunit 2
MNFPWWPHAASALAPEVDRLFLALLLLCGTVALGVFGMIAFFCLRYREGSRVPRPEGPHNTTPIEIAWMVIPLFLFLILFAWAGRLFLKMYTPAPGAIPIYVVGKQWMWKVQYPDGRREINALHVATGQDVVLLLSSEDVIHSFFVPAFRIKKDAVPGRYTRLAFRATRPGMYHLFCSQYCGTDHATMIGTVVVLAPKDYEAWEGASLPETGLAAEGGRLYHQVGCAGCHEPGATSVPTIHAPLLDGLYGKPVALQDGTVVTADEQYLRDSILLPNAQIAAGYAPVMPTYQGRLSPEQVNALVAYLVSRKDRTP